MISNARIFQINSSRGGVPKNGMHHAEVNELGIVGDKQRDRRYHGGPERALCLYPLERILALQGEGHPIYPGSTGENITTLGLDPDRLIPGTRIRLGKTVEIEILSYASPCKNIIESFSEGETTRVSQKVHPGWSRTYARVVTVGEIRIGDPIVIL